MGFVWITKAQTTFDRTPGSFQGTGHRYEYWVRAITLRTNMLQITHTEIHQNHAAFLVSSHIYADSITIQRCSPWTSYSCIYSFFFKCINIITYLEFGRVAFIFQHRLYIKKCIFKSCFVTRSTSWCVDGICFFFLWHKSTRTSCTITFSPAPPDQLELVSLLDSRQLPLSLSFFWLHILRHPLSQHAGSHRPLSTEPS